MNMLSVYDLPKVLLFYVPAMADLAEKIAKQSKTVQLGKIIWEPREDGFDRIEITEPYKVKGAIVMFLTNFDTPQSIIQQFAVMSKLPRLGLDTFKILSPCFPSLTLRGEGGEKGTGMRGEVYTTTTLARLISALPKGKSGPTEIVIWDIHHLQERFYFEDDVIARLENSMALLIEKLDREIDNNMSQYHSSSKGRPTTVWVGGQPVTLPPSANPRPQSSVPPNSAPPAPPPLAFIPPAPSYSAESVPEDAAAALAVKVARRKADPNSSAIVFPSESASKRFKRYFHGFDHIICTSYANGEKDAEIMEGNPKGRKCVLVDDVIYSGTTMISCCKLLRAKGATTVSVYVTHGVFTNDSWKLFTPNLFDLVMITDSCPAQAALLRQVGEPFEVLSLAPLIAPIVDEEAFLRYASEESSDGGDAAEGGRRLLREASGNEPTRSKL